MYDVENKKLKYCYSYDYKFYHNKTRSNRKYCFKYDYECPDVYHYLETTNNECIDYTPPTTIPEIPTTIPEIPTTIPEKPTTIPEIPTTIPEKLTTIPEKPTTIPEKPTTIPVIPTTIPEIPTTIPEKQTTIITEIPTTIVTEKQTTIIIEKPTTIPEIPTTIPEKQTTIVTEKITTIVTEKPTIIETQKPTTINTEKPTTIITQKQTIINTEKPIHIIDPTNTEKQIDSTIIKDQCASINKLIEARGNVTNQELYEEFYKEILSKYSQDGNSVTCKAKDDHEFQVTTPSQEINDLKNNTPQPIIDLSGCEVGLKKSNGIDGNNSLILYKYYKDAELAKEKEVQFEVYEPINYTKLNLTGCKKIILYIPVNLNQSIKVYQNIIDQGYDPFDLGDKFYREICTQYDSENGTDVLLDAREEYYYSPIVDETTCQGNCHYSNYSLDTKYLMCECDVNNNGIVTLDVKHIDEENVAYSFYRFQPYS